MTEGKRPPDEQDPTELSPTEFAPRGSNAGKRVGPFRLLQKLGEGGMGEVWEAEQTDPVKRRVAVKLVKLGMDTKQVVARFEAERQALALMNHPNIAKVFDGGVTPEGRPYFVMELVKGEPITDFCDKQKLTTRERLELFTQVCEGVQHAHRKAIIHRDLKPSNVLVTTLDGRAVPKIIDFGIAKAVEHRLTERTLFTELGQLVGTPEYMSPEQAEMTGLDIDTRTDVYSLGAMLYELLVGTGPFDAKELREAGFDEIRRRIREEEPSRPSTRLSTLGDVSSETARWRRTDPTGLARQLRGDLDWITMKCLAKDRNSRYGSPSDLAADLRRHLTGEPVMAGPPGVRYRMGKFLARHKLGVAAAALALAAVATGLAGITIGYVRATRAETAARLEAERSARLTREVAHVMSDVSSLLVAEDHFVDPDGWIRVLYRRGFYQSKLGALVDVAKKLEPVSSKQPEGVFPLSEESLRDFIAKLAVIHARAGLTRQAEELRERALGMGDPHRDVFGPHERWDWRQVYSWARACAKQGQVDKAIRWLGELEERGAFRRPKLRFLKRPERELREDFPGLAGNPEFETIVAGIREG